MKRIESDFQNSIFTFINLVFICLLLMSCSGKEGEGTILPDGLELAEGDIVFRRGTGLMSHTVVAADGGKYSHMGIVVDSAGVKMVVHAVPDEPDFPGDVDRVKMELPSKFFSTFNAVMKVKLKKNDKGEWRIIWGK